MPNCGGDGKWQQGGCDCHVNRGGERVDAGVRVVAGRTRRSMLRDIPRKLLAGVATSAALVSIVLWISAPSASHAQVMPLWPLLGIVAALVAGMAGVAACRPGHAVVSPALLGMLERLLARRSATVASGHHRARSRRTSEPSRQGDALAARRQRQVAAALSMRAERQALGRRRKKLEREGLRLLVELAWIDHQLDRMSDSQNTAATASALAVDQAGPAVEVHQTLFTLALQARIAANQRATDRGDAPGSSESLVSSVRVRQRDIIRPRVYRPRPRSKTLARVLALSQRNVQRRLPYRFHRQVAALAQVAPHCIARFERSLSHWLIGSTYLPPMSLVRIPTGTPIRPSTSTTIPPRSAPTQTPSSPPLSAYRITPVLKPTPLTDSSSEIARAGVRASTPQLFKRSSGTSSNVQPSGEERCS